MQYAFDRLYSPRTNNLITQVFEDECGRVRGHFGPLNTIDVHPAGTAYASGGEDGYVRVHHFDKSYFDFMYEVEREQARK